LAPKKYSGSMNNNLTVIVHSYKSSNDIQDCIDSAKLMTNNLVVVEMESEETKKTMSVVDKNEIKEKYIVDHTGYVESHREFGIGKAKTPWVFLLDADERITPELAQEISNRIQPTLTNLTNYYEIPRKEIVFGKYWLKHGGFWPNFQTRLFKKDALISWPKAIHSTPVFKGEKGRLTNNLLHYSQKDFESIVDKTINFQAREADLLFQAGRKTNTLNFFRKFLGELYKRLIKKAGFLDGKIGIIESIYQAFSKTITYLYLYEKQLKRARPPTGGTL